MIATSCHSLALKRSLRAFVALKVASWIFASTPLSAQTDSDDRLFVDSLGRTVHVSRDDVDSSLHPPATTDLRLQIPTAPKGTSQSDEVRQRILESKTGREWFPPTPPVLMPYLANLDEYGNTALQPGAVFSTDPISQVVQAGKNALSEGGLRYSFYQSLTTLSMTDVASGSSALQYYTATFFGKWALTELTNPERGSWLSTEVNVQLGLSPHSRSQTPQGNLASIVNPQATVFGPNGIWVSELAWQQSLLDGTLVLLAGQVDQSNYLDANTYANNSQGQFLNSAFVNSMVLPLPFNNLGLNLQYQPNKNWYVMFGTGANNQAPGHSPFNDLSFQNWSYLLELGLTPKNMLGLGPGGYRLQPFLATAGGVTQAGVGLNAQQQLGTNSPFGWFGRFGVGGTKVTLDGAAAQIATGFVMQAPLKHAGLFPTLSNDVLGAGFVWGRPSAVMQPTAHANEYAIETTYVLQFTPLASIQPDFQVIWNPAANPDTDRNLIFQLQLNLTW